MLDLGWSEILIIGAVALVVIGPKELPNALKTFAYWMKQARKMAREFHSGVDEMIRQAELDDARKAVEDARQNIGKQIENSVDPTGEVKSALIGLEKSDAAADAGRPGVARASRNRRLRCDNAGSGLSGGSGRTARGGEEKRLSPWPSRSLRKTRTKPRRCRCSIT